MPPVKLIVIGPGEAGKSTLIGRLATGAVNLAVRGRTVAMDHGMLRRGSDSIALVGVPGQERFAAIREVLVRGARGAIWVHPSGQQTDPQTVELLAAATPERLPYVVFINQRPDSVRQESFPVPGRLSPPRDVLRGSLLSDQNSLGELVDAIWRLAGAGRDAAQEEGTK